MTDEPAGAGHHDGEAVAMRAQVGDRLVIGADRVGIVVAVPAKNGSPPYIIKWQKDGHIAMVLPDQYSRIIPAGQPADSEPKPGKVP